VRRIVKHEDNYLIVGWTKCDSELDPRLCNRGVIHPVRERGRHKDSPIVTLATVSLVAVSQDRAHLPEVAGHLCRVLNCHRFTERKATHRQDSGHYR
jgi:hypothetical protein